MVEPRSKLLSSKLLSIVKDKFLIEEPQTFLCTAETRTSCMGCDVSRRLATLPNSHPA